MIDTVNCISPQSGCYMSISVLYIYTCMHMYKPMTLASDTTFVDTPVSLTFNQRWIKKKYSRWIPIYFWAYLFLHTGQSPRYIYFCFVTSYRVISDKMSPTQKYVCTEKTILKSWVEHMLPKHVSHKAKLNIIVLNDICDFVFSISQLCSER